jgi:hypothetical protein
VVIDVSKEHTAPNFTSALKMRLWSSELTHGVISYVVKDFSEEYAASMLTFSLKMEKHSTYLFGLWHCMASHVLVYVSEEHTASFSTSALKSEAVCSAEVGNHLLDYTVPMPRIKVYFNVLHLDPSHCIIN